ncbi:MAG: hypothetical protein H0V80_06005, partial [Acidobacteria bacterium]|nr:hypothetical protein [Acidobacteriota bacterium]
VAAGGNAWQGVRQLSASARYDRALAAIDQMAGVPAADQQAERRRVVEGALRAAQTARRVAEDLQRTRTPQYQQGVAAQQHGEQQQGAGRMRQAVTAYMTARTHFDQAFPGNTANATAPAAGTDAATPPTAPSEAPAPAATATAPGVDLSTWSTAEAHAVITAFAGAYGSRDIAGMRRIWPVIDPAWEAEFKEAFATKGELVCVFEQTSATRTSDQFVVTARLLTQLPDGDQRRRSLVITLEPQRDRLVISRIRVR